MIRPAIAALALAAPLAAQAPDNADVRAAADAFAKAQRDKDVAALDRLLASEFLFTRGTGAVGDKREFIAGFSQPGMTIATFDLTDPLLLRVAPDAAVVGGEGRISGSEQGRPFTEHFRFAHTLTRREGRWLIIFTQVTPLPK